jgi:putative DNA methylase
MTITNQERFDKTKELLRQGLLPFIARELAYRLDALCQRKKWAAEALAYNSLVQSWSEMATLASTQQRATLVQQGTLFEGEQA